MLAHGKHCLPVRLAFPVAILKGWVVATLAIAQETWPHLDSVRAWRHHSFVNSKQRATRANIFEMPTRANIPWSDIESVLSAVGAELEGRGGSRIGVTLGDRFAVFHSPHPRPTTDKGMVERVRDFLAKGGVRP